MDLRQSRKTWLGCTQKPQMLRTCAGISTIVLQSVNILTVLCCEALSCAYSWLATSLTTSHRLALERSSHPQVEPSPLVVKPRSGRLAEVRRVAETAQNGDSQG